MPDSFLTPAIAMDQAPTIPKKIDYSSFPAEIRNKIMDFALRPGHIHPPHTQSGVQLLATSRQHYNEGHLMYYSDNIFHMPCGDNYQEILEKYQPKHRKLVRRVTLTCSVLDLNEDIVTPPGFGIRHSMDLDRRQVAAMVTWLRKLWRDKYNAVSRTFPNVEEIRIGFPHFKPSIQVIRIRGLQHAFEKHFWPAIERACELESSTMLYRCRERETCLVRADGSVDTDPNCLLKPRVILPMLYWMMDEAARAAQCVLWGEFQGEDKGDKLWAWLVEQKEEYWTEIRGR